MIGHVAGWLAMAGGARVAWRHLYRAERERRPSDGPRWLVALAAVYAALQTRRIGR